MISIWKTEHIREHDVILFFWLGLALLTFLNNLLDRNFTDQFLGHMREPEV